MKQRQGRFRLLPLPKPSKSHAQAQNPGVVIKRCQRVRYGMLRHHRNLIGDAEVEPYAFINLNPAKHDAGAHNQLVAGCAFTASPLRIVERELGPEIIEQVVLQRHARQKRIADVVSFIGRQRIGHRSLNIEITKADPPRDRWRDDPRRPIGEGGYAGWPRPLRNHLGSFTRAPN